MSGRTHTTRMTSLDAGDTAIVVLFPEVDEHIQRWRIDAPGQGIPAHVTLMYPFKRLDDIDDADLRQVRSVIASVGVVTDRFVRTGRFPGVLYLEPEDDARFRGLTEELSTLWPAHAPYGGRFEDVIPHLTIAHGAPEAELDAIERRLAPHLPIDEIALDAWLMTFDGDEWTCEHRFAFRLNDR